MKSQRFVLDTSAFTNPAADASKAIVAKNIEALLALIARAKRKGVSCYLPPSAFDELSGMLERKGVPKKLLEKLDIFVIQKAPSRLEILVPAEFVYEYVIEVRERFNKGLREAEKAVLGVKHKPEQHDKMIRELRSRYKEAIRRGLIDSKEDLDVVLLAKELNAAVVARDEGIMKWSKRWGLRFIDAHKFPALLSEYARK